MTFLKPEFVDSKGNDRHGGTTQGLVSRGPGFKLPHGQVNVLVVSYSSRHDLEVMLLVLKLCWVKVLSHRKKERKKSQV